MLPITSIPDSVSSYLLPYRDLFCRQAGFEHVGRYLTGLILSPNKTLQAIYDLQVYTSQDDKPSRRAMHAAVFEAPWQSGPDGLMKRHRQRVSLDHTPTRCREVISLDWTFSHHERGPKIFATSRAYDYVERRTARFQTVVTACISNRKMIDCIGVEVQLPMELKEEEAYLKATSHQNHKQMEGVRNRILELLHHLKHRLEYRKRTEMALEMVREIEAEGHFPNADYAFDSGVLTLELTSFIENCGKHWVSEIESNRLIQWQGKWRHVSEIGEELKANHPESFRPLKVRLRNGDEKQYFAFTKVVRLKRYGRKRLVILHEQADLKDGARYLLTDALHWESGRVIQSWSYRWSSEIFHEFGKQVTGFESSQVRKEEAVKRHFQLSCVAQSIVQRAQAEKSKSEKYEFAADKVTIGQRCRAIGREVMKGMLELSKKLFEQGRTSEEVLDILLPA